MIEELSNSTKGNSDYGSRELLRLCTPQMFLVVLERVPRLSRMSLIVYALLHGI